MFFHNIIYFNLFIFKEEEEEEEIRIFQLDSYFLIPSKTLYKLNFLLRNEYVSTFFFFFAYNAYVDSTYWMEDGINFLAINCSIGWSLN